MLVTKDLKRLRTNRSSPRLPGIRNLSPSLAPNHTWRVWSSEGSLAANCDFNFHSADSTEVVEYHVNATYAFDERLRTLPFGASLSVQKPINSWPVVLMGQDGAIFKLFLFLAKIWVCPNGERALLPKDEASGTMISSSISREHGLIREVAAEIVIEINLQRVGQQYSQWDRK